MDDSHALQQEIALVACLVRNPDLAVDRTTAVASGMEEFGDAELGQLFDRLRSIRDNHPKLAGLGIRLNIDVELRPALDRALAWWDRELNQLHPLLPTVADEVELLAVKVNERWRARRIDDLQADVRRHYHDGEHVRAGELAAEVRELVRTSGQGWEATDPYVGHSVAQLTTELAQLVKGSGLPVHPRLDALLHLHNGWLDELVLLGAKTKVGKTRLAAWWVARMAESAERLRPEAQVMMFCTELTRAELVRLLQDNCHDASLPLTPTPCGRPRMLLFGKEFFAEVGGDPQVRLRAIQTELRRFAAANLHWAHQHDLTVTNTWFACVVVDYLTSMLAVGNDFTTCEEFVRGLDTSVRVFDPGWVGLDPRRFNPLAGLRCPILLCEQVNARREPPARVSTDPRSGKPYRPPLEPPSYTEINGSRSIFETASVYLMLTRDPENRVHPPEEALLRVTGRSVATEDIPLRFINGVFQLVDEAVIPEHTEVPDSSTDAELEIQARQQLWEIQPYVVAPPAVLNPNGSLSISQDRWVRVDPAVKGWQPPEPPTANGQTSLL